MSTPAELFGSDLRLLGNLERQNDRSRGSDLWTHKRPGTGAIDLETLDSVDNLSQALLLRFLTPVGELTALGHPDYGSRLFELIGELNNDTNRNRAKLYVLQALAAEPRVQKVLSATVSTDRKQPTLIMIKVLLLPIYSTTPFNLVFPFSLEGG